MDAAQFRLPVRIIIRDGEPVTEFYSAAQALDFLLAWPHQDGPIYERAMSACFAATVDAESEEEARKAFMSFARVCGLLSKDMMYDPLHWEGETTHIHG
ncbi:DUF982 domain-containing protein [Aquamicrobium sp. LC103]|uniref:DUF982 domain-containing protein n=1 Tax=Aquamicrobium sp. LC103 TaxID=1120658 RepID=UPI00063E7006|nr:DUF982 domain-containing protein [Aquamicrobium sp. LC103]TKT74661.1 DUF982 domain-containing protein [Aquamicrobium sp. LC103]